MMMGQVRLICVCVCFSMFFFLYMKHVFLACIAAFEYLNFIFVKKKNNIEIEEKRKER